MTLVAVGCEECEGNGTLTCETCEGHCYEKCPECGGERYYGDCCPRCEEPMEECHECDEDGEVRCAECDGVGTVDCLQCEGNGYVEREEEEEITPDPEPEGFSVTALKPITTVEEKETPEPVARKACPLGINRSMHFRGDGTCRCDDSSHIEMLQFGYVWNGILERWTT